MIKKKISVEFGVAELKKASKSAKMAKMSKIENVVRGRVRGVGSPKYEEKSAIFDFFKSVPKMPKHVFDV